MEDFGKQNENLGLDPEKSRYKYEKTKNDFNVLVETFQERHSLETLHSIVDFSLELLAVFDMDVVKDFEKISVAIEDLTLEEKEKYRARTAARSDLAGVFKTLRLLQGNTDTTEEEYQELKETSMILSRAVGMINGNRINHTR
jgi:hypothetical protein